MQKLAPLTSLRFFAAAGILATHIVSRGKWFNQENLALGVSFFFVLSGFVLTYAYQDCRKWSLREFYVSRIARIWPTHLLLFVIFAGLFAANQEPITTGFLNVTLLQAWFPLQGYAFSYNGVSWSISVEAFFYLLFPLIIRSPHFWRWYAGSFIALAFYLVLAQKLLVIPAHPSWGEVSLGNVGHQVPLTRLPEFLLGIAAARYFLSTKTPAFVKKTDLAVLLCIVSIVVFCLTKTFVRHHTSSVVFSWYRLAGCQVSFAALILVLAYGQGYVSRLLSHSILVFLGEASFALYMVHSLVLRLVERSIGEANWQFVIVSIMLSLAASFLIHLWFEKPMRHLLLLPSVGGFSITRTVRRSYVRLVWRLG